jgi:alanyl-tRNA synthetase
MSDGYDTSLRVVCFAAVVLTTCKGRHCYQACEMALQHITSEQAASVATSLKSASSHLRSSVVCS